MLSNVIEPACVDCRNCIQNEAGYTCTAWDFTAYLSPHRARPCEYFELPGAPCRTMKKSSLPLWKMMEYMEVKGHDLR